MVFRGVSGDIPVVGDYDDDGKSDVAVFRPSDNTWYILNSGGGTNIRVYGVADDIPVAGDFIGDSRTDITIFRPSTNTYWIFNGSRTPSYRSVQRATSLFRPTIAAITRTTLPCSVRRPVSGSTDRAAAARPSSSRGVLRVTSRYRATSTVTEVMIPRFTATVPGGLIARLPVF